jgi:hypothetical protein
LQFGPPSQPPVGGGALPPLSANTIGAVKASRAIIATKTKEILFMGDASLKCKEILLYTVQILKQYLFQQYLFQYLIH